jgi:sulfatase maturation enzyme AslB (radical SAM superfamily)
MSNIKRDRVLFLDNCLFDKCNFCCQYCRTSPKIFHFRENKTILNNLKFSIEISKKYVDYAILKLSGYGEITLIKNFYTLISRETPTQIITNASLLSLEVIDLLSKFSNLNICVSLDGHLFKMNSWRVKNESLHQKILYNLNYISKKGIPLEINSVLTNRNTSFFGNFLNYLKKIGNKITCYPFPIRIFGNLENQDKWPEKEEIKKFKEEIIKNFNYYKHILPPKAYLFRLFSFLEKKERKWPCYVGFFNLGIIPNGEIAHCACGAEGSFGNIFSSRNKPFRKRFEEASTLISFPDNPTSNNCRKCFNHYEVINAFIDGEISLEEIEKIDLLGRKNVKNCLTWLKNKIKHLSK